MTAEVLAWLSIGQPISRRHRGMHSETSKTVVFRGAFERAQASDARPCARGLVFRPIPAGSCPHGRVCPGVWTDRVVARRCPWAMRRRTAGLRSSVPVPRPAARAEPGKYPCRISASRAPPFRAVLSICARGASGRPGPGDASFPALSIPSPRGRGPVASGVASR